LNPALSEYYRHKRVLITGHTGFKGGWLATWLKELGAEVCGIALPPDTDPSLHDLAGVSDGMTSHLFDLADGARVTRVVGSFQPEIVFHLAAQALVLRSYENPVETYFTNLLGSIYVLEAARQAPSVRAVLMITSDKVYHNDESGTPLREDDRLGGADPYSSSKACAELAIDSWRKSFFKSSGAARIASVRAGNVVGGGDWCADRLMPDIARAVARGEEIVLRNPHALRPWQHVLDALSGYLLLGTRLAGGGTRLDDARLDDDRLDEAWNFGPLSDDRVSVKQFADRVVAAWGKGRVRIVADPDARPEAGVLRLDSRKSVKRLNWRPLLGTDEAIDWTVRWYSAVAADPACARRQTVRQIQAYSERLGGRQ
jgi:CDP-glucose 4,6-dehydratase